MKMVKNYTFMFLAVYGHKTSESNNDCNAYQTVKVKDNEVIIEIKESDNDDKSNN